MIPMRKTEDVRGARTNEKVEDEIRHPPKGVPSRGTTPSIILRLALLQPICVWTTTPSNRVTR